MEPRPGPQKKNVELITTDLTGKDVDPIFADFEFNEDGTKVITCPAGNQPKGCTYIKQSGMCRVSFFLDQCQNCPHLNECQAKLHKRTAIVMVSQKKRNRALLQKEMKILLAATLATVKHQLDGNDTKSLEKARANLEEYLINK